MCVNKREGWKANSSVGKSVKLPRLGADDSRFDSRRHRTVKWFLGLGRPWWKSDRVWVWALLKRCGLHYPQFPDWVPFPAGTYHSPFPSLLLGCKVRSQTEFDQTSSCQDQDWVSRLKNHRRIATHTNFRSSNSITSLSRAPLTLRFLCQSSIENQLLERSG